MNADGRHPTWRSPCNLNKEVKRRNPTGVRWGSSGKRVDGEVGKKRSAKALQPRPQVQEQAALGGGGVEQGLAGGLGPPFGGGPGQGGERGGVTVGGQGERGVDEVESGENLGG